jgi:phosphoglycerol transferase MdoB-like AlkP superfamily enzyme
MVNKRSNCWRNVFFVLLCKIIASFVIFSLARALFFAYNRDFFADMAGRDIARAFCLGLRIDMSLVALICAPTIILYLLPIKRVRLIIIPANVWCFFALSLAIVLNIFDVKYFPTTLRRLGGEIFGQGELFAEGIGVYWSAIVLYWHLILFALIFLYLAWLVSFKITPNWRNGGAADGGRNSWFSLILAIVFIIIGIRGGFQSKPFKATDLPICSCGKAQFIANNAALNVIQTRKNWAVPKFRFFDDQGELSRNFDPLHTAKNFSKFHGKFAGKNIVVVILESFSAQNVGFLDRAYKVHPERTFTPFLDELLAGSMYFDGFANGTTSMDALSAILESIPALCETSFTVSPFAANRTDTLPNTLRRSGYNTLFFYGGKRNSANFGTICSHAGMEQYIGKCDFLARYPREMFTDITGCWGVHDEEQLQFVAEVLGETKEPFCAVIFTLSSYYPFDFPKKWKGKFPVGDNPLQEASAYADFALRRFFEAAEKSDWYGNTIFVLVADHTAYAAEPYYQNSVGGYSIPLAIFDPNGELRGENTSVVQQIDIMPTLLDLVGCDRPYFSFGHSAFDEAAPRFAVSYKNGTYQIITDKYVLQFDGQATFGFFLRSDFLLANNLAQLIEYQGDMKIIESLLKAFLQHYSASLWANKMTAD